MQTESQHHTRMSSVTVPIHLPNVFMFHGMHEGSHDILMRETLDHVNGWEPVYADDTMLVGHWAREINIRLSAIEKNRPNAISN